MRPSTAQDQVAGQPAKPIAFRWRSAPANFDGNPTLSKRLAELRVSAIGQGTIYQLRNLETAPRVVGALMGTGGAEPGLYGLERPGLYGQERGSYLYGGAGTVGQSRFHTLGVTREWQLEVRGLSASEFELDSYAVYVGPRPRRD
jgi:hypothetical protein